MKIVFCVNREFEFSKLPQWFADRAGSEFGASTVRLDSYRELDAHIADTDILLSWQLRSEQWQKAKKLRWIHVPASGANGVLIPEVVASDIPVTNAAEVHGEVVAEHVMALMLAAARRLDLARDFQREQRWDMEALWKAKPPAKRVRGAQVLVVGMGAIGKKVAAYCSTMGMRVTGVRSRTLEPEDNVERVVTFAEFAQVLPEFDFVVLCVPTTPETREMMNAETLAKMKQGSWLINVGRGALVNESALVNSMQKGRPGGAALDVFEKEPLAADSPLWTAPNVIITPHEGGFYEQMWEVHYEIFRENMQRFLARKPLRNLVDKQRGY